MKVARLALSTCVLASALACEFNRDGRRCEPRIPVGGSCALGLSPAEDFAPREPVVIPPGPGSPGPVDQGCEANAACESFSQICRALPGPGEPCLDGSLCAPPSTCDFSTSRCFSAGQDGDPCPFGTCAAGHRCVQGSCVASQLFSPCNASIECPAEHFCEPTATRSCLRQVGLGEACASSAACLSPAICGPEGVCIESLAEGDECQDACGPGLFCTFRTGNGGSDDGDDAVPVPIGAPRIDFGE